MRASSKAKAIKLKPWNDMQVHVKHRLSRCGAIGEQQIDALTAKIGTAHCLRHPSSHGHHRTSAGVIQASKIRHMMIGNDRRVRG